MDFIFFATNALAAGLTALLLIYRYKLAGQTPFRLVHYLSALILVLVYYSLDAYFFSRYWAAYAIANLLPIVSLIAALALVLHQRAANDR